MAVTAKFEVLSITAHSWNPEARTIKFQAVTSGAGNASWSKWTPSGAIEMQVTNPAAYEQFELGKKFILTFEEAP